MATNQSRRSRDEEETIDDQGRKHDSRGRFISGGSESENEGGGNGRGGNGRGSRRGRSGSQGQGTSRVISRAVRVLDEIESRIAELREELERQSSGSRSDSGEDDEEGGGGRGFAGMDEAERGEIARRGGRASHERGNANEWDEEEAREASRSRNR
jgi:hypothetical protein